MEVENSPLSHLLLGSARLAPEAEPSCAIGCGFQAAAGSSFELSSYQPSSLPAFKTAGLPGDKVGLEARNQEPQIETTAATCKSKLNSMKET